VRRYRKSGRGLSIAIARVTAEVEALDQYVKGAEQRVGRRVVEQRVVGQRDWPAFFQVLDLQMIASLGLRAVSGRSARLPRRA